MGLTHICIAYDEYYEEIPTIVLIVITDEMNLERQKIGGEKEEFTLVDGHLL